MGLVFDRRATHTGAVTHALLVGVSNYSFLPLMTEAKDPQRLNLRRLASPALSATVVAAWLMDHADALAKPLASLRLLISPSPQETAILPPLPAVAGTTGAPPQPATMAQVTLAAKAWRADAGAARDGVTVFYFSGHGLQKFGEPLLCMADLCDPAGGPTLGRAVDQANLLSGMAPSQDRPDMARSQFYFIDACRDEVGETQAQSQPGAIFDGLSDRDDRSTPVYFGAWPGGKAQTLAGQPTDYCHALLHAFTEGADEPDMTAAAMPRPWKITTTSLHRAMANHFQRSGTGGFAPIGGPSFREETFRLLPNPPQVQFSVVVGPSAAIPLTDIDLAGSVTLALAADQAAHPYPCTVPGGVYRLTATPRSSFRPFDELTLVSQKMPLWSIQLANGP